MATLAPQPKLQFFDNNGNPLSGGRLYTYVAGTTTPQATYTDETGTVTNTNPVILDSRGEANVWFGPGTYKLKLATAADVEVWSVDDIGSQLSVADLATGIQTWLGNPTSANLRTAMVDETGTGALVFANAPTLVLPNVDVINEATPGFGVTVDGVLLKDNDVSAQDVTGSATVNAPIVNATGTSSSGGIVRLYEDTDNGTNYVQLTAPSSIASNRVLTLPDSVGTAGQALTTNGSGTLSFVSIPAAGTMLTAVSQTELEFPSIPAWAKRITMAFAGLSASGNVQPLIQMGTATAYEVTGYTTAIQYIGVGSSAAVTSGWPLAGNLAAANTYGGKFEFNLIDASANTWVGTGQILQFNGGLTPNLCVGYKSLGSVLTRIRLYMNGTDTFDAGSVNILYE
jgi:hypothetical protein